MKLDRRLLGLALFSFAASTEAAVNYLYVNFSTPSSATVALGPNVCSLPDSFVHQFGVNDIYGGLYQLNSVWTRFGPLFTSVPLAICIKGLPDTVTINAPTQYFGGSSKAPTATTTLTANNATVSLNAYTLNPACGGTESLIALLLPDGFVMYSGVCGSSSNELFISGMTTTRYSVYNAANSSYIGNINLLQYCAFLGKPPAENTSECWTLRPSGGDEALAYLYTVSY